MVPRKAILHSSRITADVGGIDPPCRVSTRSDISNISAASSVRSDLIRTGTAGQPITVIRSTAPDPVRSASASIRCRAAALSSPHLDSISAICMRLPMVVGATLLLTACGKAVESITEKAIEAQTDGEIDISLDGNSISFESEDGSKSINIQSSDDDETVTISATDGDGNEFRADSGGKIPADFPMPVFQPSEVNSVVTTEMSVGTAFVISLEIAQGDADAAIAFYEDWFASEGMKIVMTLSGPLGDFLAESDAGFAQVTVVEGPPFELLLAWSPVG